MSKLVKRVSKYKHPINIVNKGYKKKIISSFTRKLFYEFPREKRKGIKEKQFFGLIKTFYKKIGTEIIESNWKYTLGYACGSLEIKQELTYSYQNPLTPDGNITKYIGINWAETQAFWRNYPEQRNKMLIKKDLEEYKTTIYWNKRKSHLINIDIYSFIACKRFKMAAYAATKSGKSYFSRFKHLV
jgi:hypothetical protein